MRLATWRLQLVTYKLQVTTQSKKFTHRHPSDLHLWVCPHTLCSTAWKGWQDLNPKLWTVNVGVSPMQFNGFQWRIQQFRGSYCDRLYQWQMYQMYQFGIVKTEYFLILKTANSLRALFIFTESLIPTIFSIYELLSMNGCKYLQKKDVPTAQETSTLWVLSIGEFLVETLYQW